MNLPVSAPELSFSRCTEEANGAGSVDRGPFSIILIAPLFCCALITLAILSAVVLSWRDEEATISQWKAELSNYSTLVAAQANQNFTVASLVLKGLGEDIGDVHVQSPEDAKQKLGTRAIQHLLVSRIKSVPYIDVIDVISLKGEIINSSGGSSSAENDVFGSQYIKDVLMDLKAEYYISLPSEDQGNPARLVYICRKLTTKSGEAVGFIVLGLPVELFRTFYRLINIGPGSAITLFKSDGTVLAKFPPVGGVVGRTYDDSWEFQPNGPDVTERVETTSARGNVQTGTHIPRVRAFRAVPDFPLAVTVTATEELVFKNWRRQAILIASITIIFGLLAVTLTIGIVRLLRVQSQINLRLRHQFELRLDAQASLQRLNDDLENRIGGRTKELSATVEALESEVKERARAQATLRQSNETLDAVVRSSPLAIIGLDAGYHVITWNTGAEAMLGYSAEEAIGRVDPSILTDQESDLQDLLTMIAAGTTVREVEGMRQRKDGTLISVRVAGARLQDADEKFQGLLFNIEDITEVKSAQKKIEQAQRMEAIGQLTGGIAHDFNNLLSVVIGNLELALDTIKPDDEAGQCATFALRAAERAAELTHRLLAFARRQRLAPKTVNVEFLIHDVMPLIERTLAEDIEISVRVAAQIWTTFIDPGELENVIVNLAINARDAMPRGGRLIIEASNRTIENIEGIQVGGQEDNKLFEDDLPPGEYVMLIVTDTGFGIPPEILHRVFEPFFTTKETGKGSGLGLSMVLGFAQQSGGAVRINSEMGKGTAVRLYLPRGEQTEPQLGLETSIRTEIPKGSETVLIVEDDAAVRAVAERFLKDLGYKISTASNGLEAIELLSGGLKPDLLLTDVILPGGIGGRELVEKASTIYQGLKVLFNSGYSAHTLHGSGRAPADVRFLPKPFHRYELATAVRAALDGA